MGLDQLLQRVVTYDIAIENKEKSFRIIIDQFLLDDFERTCGAQRLFFFGVGDFDFVFFL